MGVRMILGLFGAHQAAAAVIPIAQAIGVLVGAALLVVMAIRLLPRKPLSFLALGFLAVALCAPALHSWYVLWGALLLPLIDKAARYVRPAVWTTVILLSFDAVNLSWRNSAVALGVALVLVLAGLARAQPGTRVDAQGCPRSASAHSSRTVVTGILLPCL